MSVGVAEESGNYGHEEISAAAAADKAIVDEALAKLAASYEKWETLLAEQARETFEADLGDVTGVVNCDGRLIEFALAADVMSTYTYAELQDRINALLAALREAVAENFESRNGSIDLE